MPTITKHLINRNCTFINQMYPPLVFVVHRTAGHVNVQQLYDYWQSTCISSHFGISYDGYGYDPLDIWQFVELWDGAGANCCPESGHHPFFDRGGNANTYTISVEVCTPNTNNQGLMTSLQEEALVFLIQDTCATLGIPINNQVTYWNDYENTTTWIGDNGGIGEHRDVSPHNKRMCTGDPHYSGQMQRIIDRVRSGGTTPPVTSDERAKYMSMWGSHKNEMYTRMWEQMIVRMNQMQPSDEQIPIPRTGTGIYTFWTTLLDGGNYIGGVTSEEYPFSSDNEDYMVQNFSAGQISWRKRDGKPFVIYSG